MQFEAKEPSYGAFPTFCKSLKGLMNQYTLVPAYMQRRGIHKADTGTSTQQDFLGR